VKTLFFKMKFLYFTLTYIFIIIINIFGGTYAENETSTTNVEMETTLAPKCIHGSKVGNSCQCYEHYQGNQCESLKCNFGYEQLDQSRCYCFLNYYGTYCQNKCDHGVWIYLNNYVDHGRCQCIYGWTGMACDIPHPYTNSYQSYTASIIFLCLAAFLIIACVLCVANRRRRLRMSSRQSVENLNRAPDQRQYGSFFEGHDNLASTISSYETHPPPPPLPKYEDALKLPAYVAPVIQAPSSSPEPPPYAEISTITEIVSNSQTRATPEATIRAVDSHQQTLPRQSSLEITNDHFV